MRAIFLADGNIFTTGFSRMSERQLALWKSVCVHLVLLNLKCTLYLNHEAKSLNPGITSDLQ